MDESNDGKSLTSIVFSWSIQDVLNKQLYNDKVSSPFLFILLTHECGIGSVLPNVSHCMLVWL